VAKKGDQHEKNIYIHYRLVVYYFVPALNREELARHLLEKVIEWFVFSRPLTK